MKSFKPGPSLGSSLKTPRYSRSAHRGGAWTATSKAYRKAHPICEVCLKRATTECHHVVPLHDGGPMHSWSNLMGLCFECHQQQHHA